MTDEEKKAIQRTNNDRRIVYGKDVIINNKNLEIVLNLIEKQEKIIDEMAEQLDDYTAEGYEKPGKERIKQYYREVDLKMLTIKVY